jgi:hypothetical protein
MKHVLGIERTANALCASAKKRTANTLWAGQILLAVAAPLAAQVTFCPTAAVELHPSREVECAQLRCEILQPISMPPEGRLGQCNIAGPQAAFPGFGQIDVGIPLPLAKAKTSRGAPRRRDNVRHRQRHLPIIRTTPPGCGASPEPSSPRITQR